ncbi:MAG: hypothetical protein AAGC55_24115, partial [Myxococcota bacterium]
MAPEQITGAPLSIAADLYSLGITLFETLTGRLPFLGPDFVAEHLGGRAPAATAIAPEIAAGWDPVLARLLVKNPGERYGSIDELRRAISDIDLGRSDGPAILILPRTGKSSADDASASASSSFSAVVAEAKASSSAALSSSDEDDSENDGEERPRYQFETAMGQTELSQLSRAVDTALNRSVIIERFTGDGVEEQRRLYALARGGGPFVQRALAYDKSSGVAVFEAPAGVPMAELQSAAQLPTRRQVARLLKRLARAVAPLHESGVAHGAISPTTVLIDDEFNPTILVCGLGRTMAVGQRPGPQVDVAAIIELAAALLDVEPSARAVAVALLGDDETAARLSLNRAEALDNGEALYAFADRLEVALLTTHYRAR